jgi:hypothetical protein
VPKAVCILGAGYSFAAGLPLTANVFSAPVWFDSEREERTTLAVRRDYLAWIAEHPRSNPEEYLAELLESFPGRPVTFQEAAQAIMIAFSPSSMQDESRHNSRYVAGRITSPLRSRTHRDFWSVILKQLSEIAVVTTNYGVLVHFQFDTPKCGQWTTPR